MTDLLLLDYYSTSLPPELLLPTTREVGRKRRSRASDVEPEDPDTDEVPEGENEET